MRPEEAFEKLESIARENNIDEYELFWNSSSAVAWDIEKKKISRELRNYEGGYCVRIVDKNKIGTGIASDVRRAFENARQSARYSEELTGYCFPDQKARITLQDDQEIDADALKEVLRNVVASCDSYVKIPAGNFSWTKNEIAVMNSHGLYSRASYGSVSGSLVCSYSDSSGYYSLTCKDLEQFEKQSRGFETAWKRAKEFKKAKTLVSGSRKTKVILTEEALCDITGMLMASVLCKNIYTRASRLSPGKKEFSEGLSIKPLVNDSMLPSPGIDGEGLKINEEYVVDKGLFARPLANSKYAFKMKKKGLDIKPGNAVRISYKGSVDEGTYLLEVKPGNGFDTERGDLIVMSVQGAHTCNPLTGSFSLSVEEGYLIEDSSRLPVKGFNITGNIFEVFSDAEFSKDRIKRNQMVLPEVKCLLTVTA